MKRGAIGAAIAVISLAGCVQYTGAFTNKDFMRPPELFKYNASYTVNAESVSTEATDLLINSTDLNDPDKPPEISFDIIRISQSGAFSADARNLLQNMLISRSDYLCAKFLDRMFIRITARQVTLDQIALTANAVGGFSKTIASEMNLVSGIATGTQSNYEKRILQEQMTTLIINKIKANRTAMLTQIETKRSGNGSSSYKLSDALNDTNTYHDKCSFIDAMSSLTEVSNKGDNG